MDKWEIFKKEIKYLLAEENNHDAIKKKWKVIKNKFNNYVPNHLLLLFKKIEVNLTSLYQYVAPNVLGIISETNKISTVIILETIPTTKSSDISIPKISCVVLLYEEKSSLA